MRRHDEQGVRVATEHRGAGNPVDGVTAGQVALGEMGRDQDCGAGVLRQFFQFIEDLSHLGVGVLLPVAVGLVDRINDEQVGTGARACEVGVHRAHGGQH